MKASQPACFLPSLISEPGALRVAHSLVKWTPPFLSLQAIIMFLGFYFILGFSATLFTAIAAAPISATGTTTNATSSSVTSATLLSNAQAAQQINDQSRSAQLSDSCASKHLYLSPFFDHSNNNPDGQSACIANAIIQCHNGQWEITLRCPKTQKCFALPSLTSQGTVRIPPFLIHPPPIESSKLIDRHLYKRSDRKIGIQCRRRPGWPIRIKLDIQRLCRRRPSSEQNDDDGNGDGHRSTHPLCPNDDHLSARSVRAPVQHFCATDAGVNVNAYGDDDRPG